MAIVPIFDVEAAVAEITRARESGLRGGILIPSMWQPYEPYHDPRYDPVWAACPDLEMPVHVHSGAADRASYGEHVGIYVAEVRWWSTRPLWFLLWSGTFERFPDLTFVTTECGAFWAPDLLWTSDLVYDREHAAKKLGTQLTDAPADAARASTSTGTASSAPRTPVAASWPGATRSAWPTSCGGTTSPTPRGPGRIPASGCANAFSDIPVDETQQILGDNAAACYGFDTEALRPLADRFGPTPEDLGQTGDDLGKWADLAAAGRPWLTGKEALEISG